MQIPRALAAFARWSLAFSTQWRDHNTQCLRLTFAPKISEMTATRTIIHRTVILGRVSLMSRSCKIQRQDIQCTFHTWKQTSNRCPQADSRDGELLASRLAGTRACGLIRRFERNVDVPTGRRKSGMSMSKSPNANLCT